PQLFSVGRRRFSRYTTPTPFVKTPAYRIHYGVLRTYIHVEAIFDMLQCSPQYDVLEILCVGNEHHAFLLIMNLASSQHVPINTSSSTLTTSKTSALSAHS